VYASASLRCCKINDISFRLTVLRDALVIGRSSASASWFPSGDIPSCVNEIYFGRRVSRADRRRFKSGQIALAATSASKNTGESHATYFCVLLLLPVPLFSVLPPPSGLITEETFPRWLMEKRKREGEAVGFIPHG